MYSNPILEQLNQTRTANNNLQPIKNLMQQVKVASNPQLALQNLIASNPQLQALLRTGVSPQQIAQNLAQQKGVDLNEIIRQLTS